MYLLYSSLLGGIDIFHGKKWTVSSRRIYAKVHEPLLEELPTYQIIVFKGKEKQTTIQLFHLGKQAKKYLSPSPHHHIFKTKAAGGWETFKKFLRGMVHFR